MTLSALVRCSRWRTRRPLQRARDLGGEGHDQEGALILQHWMPDRVVWPAHHHLDLLRAPAATRRRGRDPRAQVCSDAEAVDAALEVALRVRA